MNSRTRSGKRGRPARMLERSEDKTVVVMAIKLTVIQLLTETDQLTQTQTPMLPICLPLRWVRSKLPDTSSFMMIWFLAFNRWGDFGSNMTA